MRLHLFQYLGDHGNHVPVDVSEMALALQAEYRYASPLLVSDSPPQPASPALLLLFFFSPPFPPPPPPPPPFLSDTSLRLCHSTVLVSFSFTVNMQERRKLLLGTWLLKVSCIFLLLYILPSVSTSQRYLQDPAKNCSAVLIAGIQTFCRGVQ